MARRDLINAIEWVIRWDATLGAMKTSPPPETTLEDGLRIVQRVMKISRRRDAAIRRLHGEWMATDEFRARGPMVASLSSTFREIMDERDQAKASYEVMRERALAAEKEQDRLRKLAASLAASPPGVEPILLAEWRCSAGTEKCPGDQRSLRKDWICDSCGRRAPPPKSWRPPKEKP